MMVFIINYVFLKKYKLSLQYIIYNKFNGSSTNYDGEGRNAADNNTLYVIGWVVF